MMQIGKKLSRKTSIHTKSHANIENMCKKRFKIRESQFETFFYYLIILQ